MFCDFKTETIASLSFCERFLEKSLNQLFSFPTLISYIADSFSLFKNCEEPYDANAYASISPDITPSIPFAPDLYPTDKHLF